MSSRLFERLAAICAVITSGIVAVQMVLLRRMPESTPPEVELLSINSGLWLALQWLPIIGIVLSLLILTAIALKAAQRSRALAALAWGFALLWTAFELASRFTGFMLVRQLGRTFLAADQSARTRVLEQYASWQLFSNSFGISILIVGMLYALCFTWLLWSPSLLDRIASLAFLFYALLLIAYTVAVVGGSAFAGEIVDRAYPVIRTLDRLAWAAWLWFGSDTTNRRPKPPVEIPL